MAKVVRYRMEIQGMTCTDCEHHVAKALSQAGGATSRALRRHMRNLLIGFLAHFQLGPWVPHWRDHFYREDFWVWAVED